MSDVFANMTRDVFATLRNGLATFRPAIGPPVEGVSVRVAAPDVLAGLPDAQSVLPDAEVRVMQADIARPVRGDRFVLDDGRIYFVVDKARDPDGAGAIWAVPVEARAS